MTNPAMPPAGWYPDPADNTRRRYWNGTSWTDQVQPTAPATAPAQSTSPTASSDTAARAYKPSFEHPKRSRTGLLWKIPAGLVAGFLALGFLASLTHEPAATTATSLPTASPDTATPQPAAPDATSAAAECLPVTGDLLAALGEGLQEGYSFQGTAAATRATDRDKAWFIAAQASGPGTEDGNGIGLWITNQDPATYGAGQGGSFGAVDAIAAVLSVWPLMATTDAAITDTEPGAQEALACLAQSGSR